MALYDPSTDLLVPPRRLGNLLAGARADGGYTLAEAADALGGDWSAVDLLEVETGRRALTDDDLEDLAGLYGIDTTRLVPERSHLVIDLTEGTLGVGSRTISLEGSAALRRDVLARYLALVYAMRDLPAGSPLHLRQPDIEVLSSALGAPGPEIAAELRELVEDGAATVEPRMARIRGRILVPVIGIVVAATAAGTLLLVSNDSDAAPADAGSVPAGGETGAEDAGTGDAAGAPVEIGDAVVQERLPDGSPGPVQVRD